MVKNLMQQKEYMAEFNEFKDTLFNKKQNQSKTNQQNKTIRTKNNKCNHFLPIKTCKRKKIGWF